LEGRKLKLKRRGGVPLLYTGGDFSKTDTEAA